MNDQLPNGLKPDDQKIAEKLQRVAEQSHANAQFASELETGLRNAYRPSTNRFAFALRQISPALRWAALMILLAVALSWSIRTLIPAPQPATDNTPVVPNTATPSSEIVTGTTATPTPDAGGYDFRGAKLFLEQPLPQSPGKAHVYLLQREDVQATREQAQALADRFGIQSEMYTAPGLIYGTTDFLISDGRQSLQVHSERYFTYTSDMAKNHQAFPAPTHSDAETIIREFLNSRGFDFPFRVYASGFANGYVVQPLAPDSIPLQYEPFSTPMLRVVLDENGQVLTIDASLMEYDTAPVGEYGIITAEEALQKLLDDSVRAGKMDYVHSGGNSPQEWYREYPDNQPVNLYGHMSSFPSADPNKPALSLINGTQMIGNITGMESLEDFTYVKATGQFIEENGIRIFNVESWDRKVQEAYLSGTLSRQGDQIIFTSDDGSGTQYLLTDPPADVPLDTKFPDTQLGITGVVVDGKISWTYIQFFADSMGGSGGGGGGSSALGFHQLNLSGPPVPFPTPTAQPENQGHVTYIIQEGDTVLSIAEANGITPEKVVEANAWLRDEEVLTPGKELNIPVAQQANHPLTGIYTVKEGDTLIMLAQSFGTTVDELMRLNSITDPMIFIGQQLIVPVTEAVERRVEDLRGYLSISLHNKADGTSSKEYGLDVIEENGSLLYTMEGSQLHELDAYNELPILITGTINTKGNLVVESYKVPYPDLQFQILKGTQRAEQIDGQPVLLFTTEDGKSYVEFLATNPFPLDSSSFTGYLGDLIQQEVLIIPDETFGGMPVAHVYQSSIIQEGAPEMQVQANKIPVYYESNDPGLLPENTAPNLTINEVELVYYVSNPYYQVNDPNYSQRSPHIQPVWRFHGRYDDGTSFDVLIQALRQEFLLPELAPGISPG